MIWACRSTATAVAAIAADLTVAPVAKPVPVISGRAARDRAAARRARCDGVAVQLPSGRSWSPMGSVNQRLPSGPAVMPWGLPAVSRRELGDGAAGRDAADLVAGPDSVNQRLPSGPAVMPAGPLLGGAGSGTR